jgi:DNA modification methylase
MSEWEIVKGDALELLQTLPDNSFHSMVTDPPSGTGFMNKEWDCFRRRNNPNDAGRPNVFGRTSATAPHSYGESERGNFIAFMTVIMKEAFRVLRPGAHALVWALPRTSHWTATALEDAGFDVRDVIVHAFGSGFPKSQNVGKFIDKLPGYRPDSDDGFLWDGWGTALKPASEHWILVRKPLSEKNIALNVLKWGTGALNIDACRVQRAGGDVPGWHQTGAKGSGGYQGEETFKIRDMSPDEIQARCGDKGRWPPNLILTHSAGCRLVGTQTIPANGSVTGEEPSEKTAGVYGEFEDREAWEAHGNGDGTETVEVWECTDLCPVVRIDQQSGIRKNGGRNDGKLRNPKGITNFASTGCSTSYAGDSGGASRYFPTFRYQAKPSRKEREAGLGEQPDAILNRVNPGGIEHDPRWAPVIVKNNHPTVKSIELMKYLCTMVTPPGGYILDPFAGSGSTGCAAVQLGFGFYGCEKDAKNERFVEIARARIRYWQVKALAEKPCEP